MWLHFARPVRGRGLICWSAGSLPTLGHLKKARPCSCGGLAILALNHKFQVMPAGDLQVVFTGYGYYLGIKVLWRLRVRSDGSFLEEMKGRQLTWTWGYDGGKFSKCWKVSVVSPVQAPSNLTQAFYVTCSFWFQTLVFVFQIENKVPRSLVLDESEVTT